MPQEAKPLVSQAKRAALWNSIDVQVVGEQLKTAAFHVALRHAAQNPDSTQDDCVTAALLYVMDRAHSAGQSH